MSDTVDYIELVRLAQFGDRDCLDRLAEMASVRLRSHVYRLTMEEDLTQDIVQESVLEMLKILGKLKRPDRFWPWLYGIALNKLRRHWRSEKRRKAVDIEEAGFGGADDGRQEALEKILAEELRQTVSKAMGGVKPRHRAVLGMRCYDGMSFSEIGESLGCSEFGAQMVFYRAKKSLGRQLAKNGLSKGMLLGALVIFGKMTAVDEVAAAGVAVSAASVKVGVGVAAAAIAVSKSAIVTVASIGVVAGGVMMAGPGGESGKVSEPVKPAVGLGVVQGLVSEDAATDECWYFFPEGSEGAVMRRQMAVDEGSGESYCEVLENEYANYWYDRRGGTIHVRDRRDYSEDLSVRRLPTDGPGFSAFLDKAQGVSAEGAAADYISSKRKGLLVIASQDGGFVTGISRVDRHENLLEEEYFRFAWSERARKVDDRDAMHKRGWTYFEVEGQIGGKQVYGKGRVPFVYETAGRYRAWLELDAGGDVWVDNTACAYRQVSGGEKEYYGGGSFMLGLSRPWMGLHSIDSVRRDVAGSGVIFETEIVEDEGVAKVIASGAGGRVVYTIDLEKDVVTRISVSAGGVDGELVFSYLQEIDDVGGRFAAPVVRRGSGSVVDGSGIGWLFDLCAR